ncbi:MAG TPA: phospho-N-acetylmuramoyl-pentapeptide-transferase [Bacillota bacterium]|nr:phospho-N-acetylmuramoyl-pentapeptide-transferase [Bacillota bacterium]HOP69159.1 phospho-N-acetylmuramoyl-pentapeptide-transferase [Bacillota bacterium]HPT33785.1 phospho-N-acetylmuramoyl-pentapeptide-transferase [Bacillota bacterium]HQD05496.1 phospho-N-acetylmuramoyl-pentapeptide-transferase [Bacillota bacterium]
MPQELLSGIVVSFGISLLLGPFFIRYMKRLQFGQQIREDGPARHLAKAGTPTMGGVVFLAAALITQLLLGPRQAAVFLAFLPTLGGAVIGGLDDYTKVSRGRSLGLKARNKILGQLLLAGLFAALLFQAGHSTAVAIPFTEIRLELGKFYSLLVVVMILSTTNAVNLTDGIDGLAAGTAIISFLTFLYISAMQGQYELAFFCAVMVGACFGFLVYNLHPARVFMGDAGSLALGGALAAVAILTKTELYLLIIGGVFVIETLAVILQVASFQLTGKRLFLMTPLHHHFELKGWSEWRVVTSFWALAFILALVALLDLGGGFF